MHINKEHMFIFNIANIEPHHGINNNIIRENLQLVLCFRNYQVGIVAKNSVEICIYIKILITFIGLNYDLNFRIFQVTFNFLNSKYFYILI